METVSERRVFFVSGFCGATRMCLIRNATWPVYGASSTVNVPFFRSVACDAPRRAQNENFIQYKSGNLNVAQVEVPLF